MLLLVKCMMSGECDTRQWEYVHVNMHVDIADGWIYQQKLDQYMTLTNHQTIRLDFSSSLALLVAKLVC